MVKKNKTSLIVAIIAIVFLVSVIGYGLVNSLSKESFKSNTILLKLNTITDGELSIDIKITNQKNEAQVFNLYFSGLEGIASVGESQFSLGARGSTIVNVSFKDINGEVDVYVGYLVIETADMIKKIPVILTVEDVNPFFAIIQKPLPKYEDVSPGGRVGMDIKLFNLKSKELENINIHYLMKNFDNEVLVSENEKLAVEESASVSKTIELPSNMDEGDYVFITLINYNGRSIASYYFEISEENKGEGFSLGNQSYLILIIAIVVVGLSWLIFRFFEARDKLILQLQRQQWTELKQNLNVIKAYKRELRNIEDISERRIKLERLEAQKKRVIEIIKIKHEKQKAELKRCLEIKKMHEQKKENDDFKKLREKYERQKGNLIKIKEREKRKKIIRVVEKKYARQREYYEKQRHLAKQKKIEEVKKTMAEKLRVWQRQGYGMSELKSHIKSIPNNHIISQVEAWKKEGYKLN